ncbi:hypothetical protein M427DRAFT_255930 [Gonapodya prolifera JEL478]|uniref:Alpha/beta-hydrolase n=1 Tax=Gonapodya prolifera (strain JEL478) TaxID=1344416 RepID=A0A139ALN1_GONPJ|nr:hypothetical protein M427DRAFT_255930 [Gonapodya prolifera JEL478]|eukprot:KXS17659.1 hypothetical protein M427DRAFT_255930 [Gonapodya prolifera JEL478]
MTVPFINDPSGRTVQIHYLCSGPINNSFPVIFWEADITHGMSDFWGLQMTFADAGYRSCVWDKLGQGYSDYYFFDTTSQYQDQYYHNFISMLTEKKPMIFASWSGGAGSQYQYALQHPENVHSMLFIDVAPFGIEWEMERVFKNLTAQQTAEYKRIDRLGRNAIFGILRALGVPWGLSTIFVPPPTPGSYKPADRVDEYRWFYITEKTWTSQFFLLDEYFNDTNNPYAISLPTTSTISINNLMVRQNTSTLTAVRCTGPIAVGSAACSDQVARDVYLQDKKVELWRNLTSNLARPGNLSFCTDETCKGDSFVLRNPAMTLREFKRIYAGVSIP